MKKYYLFVYLFLFTANTINAQYNYRFDKVFPPAPNFLYGEMGAHGVAVDPAGKVWIIPYKANPRDSVFVPDSNKYFYTNPVYVYNPDGTPCSFSPVGMVSTPEKKVKILNQAKTGITTDRDGNIILCEYDELIRINYQTGKGMNWASMTQLPGSISNGPLCKPAVDKNNYIYVSNVLPGYPVKILNSDFTLKEKSAAVNDYGRTLDVSQDGSTIYAHRHTKRCTYVYKRSAATNIFSVADTIFKGLAIEGSNFNPVNGLLYVSAGSYSDMPNSYYYPSYFNPQAEPGEYLGVDLSTMKIMDSLKWKFNTANNIDERNRGIAFSPDGKYAYLAGFGASNYPVVQKFTADPMTFGWSADIAVSDIYGHSMRIYYGMDYTATDGIDSKFGEALLPAPSGGVFDARFILPGTTGASLKDIRSSVNPTTSWTMQFQPAWSGTSFVFTWNPDKLPSDGFYLKDLSGGSVVNVNMKKQNNYTLNRTDINKLKIEYSKFTQVSLNTSAGWNLVSVPVANENMTPGNLFPGAASEAFEFKNGYSTVTTLEPKKGYWLKFASSGTIKLNGKPDTSSAKLNEGWNIIGLTDKSIPVAGIITNPPGIITSYWFGYNSKYVTADSIRPGYGYWVKASAAGTMNVSTSLSKQSGSFNNSEGMGELHFTDNLGRTAALYCADVLENSGRYSLPPVPPDGVFDIRFASGTFADALSRGSEIDINSARYPVKIKAEGVTVRIKDAVNGSIIDRTLKSGEEMTISNKEINKLRVTGQVKSPAEYCLFQNYPNPFNPSTVISYSLARESRVSLKIYNILGEVVRELFDGVQSQGMNDVTFNAAGLASGVYFYKMEAKASDGSGTFTDVKKLVLLR